MIKTRLSATMLALALAGCMTNAGERPVATYAPLKGTSLADALPQSEIVRLGDGFVQDGVAALEAGDFIAAQKGFNRALKFDPSNSSLHFLNGLTYHLRAEAGDTSQIEFARIGYQLALEHDASNYWAAYQLGHINFDEQRYRAAQEAFSYVLLYAPENQTFLRALAVASYYAQDIKTAVATADKVTETTPDFLRSAAMIYAAAGDFDRAETSLAAYRTSEGVRDSWAARTAGRIRDWRNVHARGGIQMAQSTTDIFGSSDTTEGLKADDSKSTKSSSSGKSDDKDAAAKGPPPEKMTLVDVVIIRSEERNATDKGVNLLSGLTATLAGTTLTYNDARTINFAATNTHVKTITYAPTLSLAASYSLNIFNDNNDHNEVIARPSLIGLDGKKSDFFTGAVLHVELNGASGSQGAVATVPIGIKMELTPKFLSDGKIEMNVKAARAFIENRSSQANFSNFTQVTKTEVSANVTMDFDDTLIISGLSEKETENLHDGVPLLQDIPGIQYLFSHEDTLDYTKSVLILVTPRKARYTYTDGTPKPEAEQASDNAEQPSLEELKRRPGWFQPDENLDAVFAHLKEFRFFQEFRRGDVNLEHWDNPVSLENRIRGAIDFLYF